VGSLVSFVFALIVLVKILQDRTSRIIINDTLGGRLLISELISILLFSLFIAISSVSPSYFYAWLFTILGIGIIRLGFVVYIILSEAIRGANLILGKAIGLSIILGASYVSYAMYINPVKTGIFWERYLIMNQWWFYDVVFLATLYLIGVISTALTVASIARNTKTFKLRTRALRDFILLYAPPAIGLSIDVILVNILRAISFDVYKIIVCLTLVAIIISILLALRQALYPLALGSSMILSIVVVDLMSAKKIFDWSPFMDRHTVDAIVGLIWGSDDVANRILGDSIRLIQLGRGCIVFTRSSRFLVTIYSSRYVDIYSALAKVILYAVKDVERSFDEKYLGRAIEERIKPFLLS